MLLFENIQLALNGLRANKMRALLTMLGIIIGIGSVIAIMTVAGSMTNSITTSMQSMGANNITVSLTQKSDSDYTEGAQTRMFRPTTPGAEDLLTDEMLADYRALYGGSIYAVSLTQSLGSYTVSTNADEAGVNATGVNTEYAAANSVELSRGRFFTEEDEEKARTVAVVSDVFAETLFPGQEAIGQAFQLTYGTKVYTFYIVGVYPYESNGLVLESTDATPHHGHVPAHLHGQSHVPCGRRLPELHGGGGHRRGHQRISDADGKFLRRLLHAQYLLYGHGLQHGEPDGEHDGDALHHQPGHRGHRGHQPAGGGASA